MPKKLTAAYRPELVALLNACKDQPDDDAPRLVLSDWLEEAGDTERAEFVRAQCRLARADDDPDWLSLSRTERDLLQQHLERWSFPFTRHGWELRFRRGLLRLEVRGNKASSLKALLSLTHTEAWAWVEHLSLRGATPKALAELLGSPVLTEVREFSTGSSGADEVAKLLALTPAFAGIQRLAMGRSFTREGAAAISGAAHLSGVVEMNLRDSEVGAEGLRCLLDSPYFPHVHSLSLYGCKLGPAAAGVLAETSGMPGLRLVDLTSTDLGAEGAAVLANCHRESLCELDANFNLIGDHGLRALAASVALPGLRAIDLGDNSISDVGLRALADSDLMGRLTHLRLSGDRFTAEGVAALVNSPRSASLEILWITGRRLGDELMRVLAASPNLGRLRVLCLENTGFGSSGLRTLLGAEWVPGLRELQLQCNQIGAEGAKILAASPALAGCRDLSIWGGEEIGPAGTLSLAQSPHLAGLVRLDMSCHPIGEEGARAILGSRYLGGLRHFDYSADGLTPEVLGELRSRFFQ